MSRAVVRVWLTVLAPTLVEAKAKVYPAPPVWSMREGLDLALAYCQRKRKLREQATAAVPHGHNLSVTRLALLEALSPERLSELAQAHRDPYSAGDPFPHAMLEGLMPEAVLRAVAFEHKEDAHRADNGCHAKAAFCIANNGGIRRRSAIDK